MEQEDKQMREAEERWDAQVRSVCCVATTTCVVTGMLRLLRGGCGLL